MLTDGRGRLLLLRLSYGGRLRGRAATSFDTNALRARGGRYYGVLKIRAFTNIATISIRLFIIIRNNDSLAASTTITVVITILRLYLIRSVFKTSSLITYC